MSTDQKQLDDFQKKIKALVDENGFEANGRKYEFIKMPFKSGKKIYSFFSVVGDEIQTGSLGFLDTPKFENEIEPLLMQYVMCDGFKLSTMPEHFDNYASDYTQFVITSIMGFSAPFLSGPATNSASTAQGGQVTTLSKPM